jgi:hypothetical protein
MGIGFVKRSLKAAKQGGHGQVYASVSIIDRRVEEHGLVMLIT